MNLKVETRILIIICFLQLTTKQQAACFWFTDTSLLLPPNGIPYVVAQDSDLDRLALATKNANAAVKLKQPEVVDLSSNEIPKGSRVDYSSNWPLAAGHQVSLLAHIIVLHCIIWMVHGGPKLPLHRAGQELAAES